MKKIVLYAAIISALTAMAQAQNENVTWQTPVAISGASDVSTQGTFFGSWAPYDGNANTLPVNGVVFEGNATLPGFSASFPQDDQSGYNSYNNPGTPNSNYNTLLQTAAYAGSGDGTIVLTWNDTPGHTYLIQAWANDGRGNGRSETFTGGANTSASLTFGNAPGQYIIGTYVADGSGSETITLSGTGSANGDYPQINLLQVRDITDTPVTNYESAVLSGNPLGYWPLDLTDSNAPNGLATDLSGNGNDGDYEGITPSGNLVPGPAPFITNAVSFNGSQDVYLGSGNNPYYLNFVGPTTLEAWAQPASLSPSTLGDIIAKGYDGNYNDQEIALRQDESGNPYYGYFGTGGLSGGQQNTNWVYLVLANDGINDYLYINGALVSSAPDTTGSISFSEFVAWAIGNGTVSGNGRTFNGNICQVAIYNYGLTSAEVLDHYFEAELNASPANSRPIIVSQPQSQASYVGGSVTFTVSAVSGLPTTNQWYSGSTPLAGQTNATLALSNLQLTNAGNYSVVVGNANGTTNSISAALTVSTPRNLQWSANDNSGIWDNDLSTNWINLANDLPTAFNPGDAVLFNDAPGAPTTVTVNATVVPSVADIDASTNEYTLNGPGNLSGSGSLIKNGSSTLSIFTPSGFAGTVAVNGGAIYAGNNCFSSVASITVTNNATLDLAGGTFNSLTPVYVSGSGTNDVGALINTYNDYPLESVDLIMTGDTTVGGPDRWDLADGAQINGAHNLTFDWSADTSNPYGEWNSPVISANVSSITYTNGSELGAKYCDSSFQNPGTVVNISANGQLIFWNGGWNGSIHVFNGAQVYLWTGPSPIDGSNVILESNAQWEAWSGSGDEPIDSAVTLNGVAHIVVGDYNRIYTNVISGVGGFVMDIYNHAMELSASNTYSGPTIIGSSGNSPEVTLTGNGSISHSSLIFFGGGSPTVAHIDVTGRPDQTLTLANGQTLAGIGGINGSLVVPSGAILSPSGTNTTLGITVNATNEVGAIAASDDVTLQGTTVIKLDGATNDAVEAGAAITYGGTLNLINISGSPLAAGDAFQIFNATSYSGSFSSITPASPGSGLAWDTSQLSSGILSVTTASSQPLIGATRIAAGSLVFSGSGGTANGAFYVLSSTNVAAPLADWTIISTNDFDGSGNFNVTNAINGANPQAFYLIELP